MAPLQSSGKKPMRNADDSEDEDRIMAYNREITRNYLNSLKGLNNNSQSNQGEQSVPSSTAKKATESSNEHMHRLTTTADSIRQ